MRAHTHALQYIHIPHRHTCIVCGTCTCVWECVCLCACMQRSEHDVRCLYCCPIALSHCLLLNQKLTISGRLCKVSYGTCLSLALDAQHGPLLTGAGDYTREPRACKTSTLTHWTISQPWYFVFINPVHTEIIYSILENF